MRWSESGGRPRFSAMEAAGSVAARNFTGLLWACGLWELGTASRCLPRRLLGCCRHSRSSSGRGRGASATHGVMIVLYAVRNTYYTVFCTEHTAAHPTSSPPHACTARMRSTGRYPSQSRVACVCCYLIWPQPAFFCFAERVLGKPKTSSISSLLSSDICPSSRLKVCASAHPRFCLLCTVRVPLYPYPRYSSDT